ncbi:MAG TPA: hypothetical protein VNX68_19165 [Nitrosopumilaceae archaeon]|jgi:hypothetical protein|nr:hypothetical protein [Nitrosopumilaceae archaeon]
MLYLSGKIDSRLFNITNIGFLRNINTGNIIPLDQIWAVDSGCFSNKGFSWIRYHEWLLKRINLGCIFATIPDVVGNAKETIEAFNKYKDLFKWISNRLAFCAQDGLEDLEIPWAEFTTLFIGGTTGWKLSDTVKSIIKEAQIKGKKVHIGRVNSLKRMKHFAELQVDSVDGTNIAFAPDINIPKILRWINKINEEYYSI